ncbi:MAG: hypothetical protein ABW321_23355 [Polyangiales bacterium]
MTDHKINKRANTLTISSVLIASLGTAACEAFVGSGPEPYQSEPPAANGGSGSTGGSGAPRANPPSSAGGAPAQNQTPPAAGSGGPVASNPPGNSPPSNPVSACDTAPQRAQATVQNYCGNCHSNPASAQGGFSSVLDVPALIASNKIVANQPEMSLLLTRMRNGSMPPDSVQRRPGAADIALLEEWINCGAQDWNGQAEPAYQFVGIDNRLRTVLDDLRSFPNPVDRERARYIDLSNLANSGTSAEQIQVYREAISFLVNSLSRGRTVIAPTAVDQDQLIFRIDLRDYLWDATTWNQLEDIYPYAVIYDQDSRLFPFDEVTSEQIREETNTQIPIIQADWFISHASRPPLYHTLLNLPDTLPGLEAQLGVDVEQNIATEQVLRSGFANAGPSQNNRVIERHELGGNRGALWLSYDFANNLDAKNIFANPLDFEEDGGEMIFNLENGLQGYFIADAAGNRLDKAPNTVVQDPASRDGAVENGLSCMNCHQEDGQLPKYDEVRDFQLNAGVDAEEIEQVLALYVTRQELQAAFDKDQNRYRTARSALKIEKLTNTTMHQLDDTHLGIVNLNGVAGACGITVDQLKRAIDATPQAFPPEITTLRTTNGGIQRDAFEAAFDATIKALGVGDQLLVDANGNAVNNNNNNDGNNNNEPQPQPQPEPEPQPAPEPAPENPDAGVSNADPNAGSSEQPSGNDGSPDGDRRR